VISRILRSALSRIFPQPTISDTQFRYAPDGKVWVCQKCGKRSFDLYGDYLSDPGWDESCMLNAELNASIHKPNPEWQASQVER